MQRNIIVDGCTLEELLQEFRAIIRQEINTLKTEKTDPPPDSEWTADMIAKCSGYHPETIKQKIRELRVRMVKSRPVTIFYRDIAKLKLKSFNPLVHA